MAIRQLGEDKNPDLSNEGLDTNIAKQATDFNSNKKSLTLGRSIMPLISSDRGSEYTNSICKVLEEIYDKIDIPNKPKVIPLDKEKIQGIAYSSVLVTLKTDKVRYFTILLEATGRKALTAGEIIAELNNASRAPGQAPSIYTADDGIDLALDMIIKDELGRVFGSGEYVSVDGLVLPCTHGDFSQLAAGIARIAYNACATDNSFDENAVNDLSIEDSIKEVPNATYLYKSNMSRSTIYNDVGNPVRADWKIDLYQSIKQRQTTSINLQNTEFACSRTCGYVDVIPEEVQVGVTPMGQAQIATRFHPHIIITSTEGTQPTIGYLLLGIVNSFVMNNPNMWLATLKPNPSDPKNNIGILNAIAKIDEGKGEKMNLADKKYDMNTVYTVIRKMVSLDPIISIDVESFGPQTSYSSVLAVASKPGMSADKQAALQTIVNTASALTNGRFPNTFPVGNIFVNEGVVIPFGKWSDKGGERDIRDIDYTFIAAHSEDAELLNQYALSTLPKTQTSYDPFLTKVGIISKLVNTAVITSKGVRVTFTRDFINALSQAVVASGLNVQYTPEISYQAENTLSILNPFFGNATLGGYQAGFAREFVNQGPSYQTGWVNTGLGRFQ